MSKINETYYWPLWSSKLLSSSEQVKIKKIIPLLSRAQVFLWRALNIYDDFLDGAGEPEKLPDANNYLRRFLEIYYRLNLTNDYYAFFNNILKKLENSNRQEVQALKLKIKNDLIIIPKSLAAQKSITNLANKSLALALGPLALISALGEKTSSVRFQALLNFFKYALSAKQLADDSHDYLDDLRVGLITRANNYLLLAAKKKRVKINPGAPSPDVHLLFAQSAAPLIIKDLENLCQRARHASLGNQNQGKNPLFLKLVLPLEKATEKAKHFQALVV